MSESQPDRTKIKRSRSQRSGRSQKSRQSLGPIDSEDDLESPFVTDDDTKGDEDNLLVMTGGKSNKRSGEARKEEDGSREEPPTRLTHSDPPARDVYLAPALANDAAGEDEEDDGVVPGTEALRDEFWNESSQASSRGTSSSSDSSLDDDEDSSTSSSSSSSGSSESETSEDDSESEGVDDDDDERSTTSSAAHSDHGVATIDYESASDVEVVAGRPMVYPMVDPCRLDTDDEPDGGKYQVEQADMEEMDNKAEETDDDAYPVVMGNVHPPPRDPPAAEITAGSGNTAKSYGSSDKQGEDTVTTAMLEPFDLEAQDATYGEDVEEGNLEDFAGGDAKGDGLREAPTASFSQDSADAEEHFEEKARRQRRRTLLTAGGILVSLAVIAGVVGGVLGSRAGDSPSPTPPNGTQPPGDATTPITNQSLFQMVANASEDGGEAILRAGSPQSEAYLSLEAAASEYEPSRWLQRYALRTVFYSTNGPSGWINQSGWESDSDECSWYQTKSDGTAQAANSPDTVCGQDHVVHSLMLVGNNVTGSLPPELSMLSGLTRLYVESPLGSSQGSLTGGIPSTLARLTRLEEFSLRNHLLDLPFPSGLFDFWSAAKLVEIANCRVPGDFPNISRLTAARNLNFASNLFQGPFPAEDLSSLSQLKIFIADENDLTGTLPPGDSAVYSALGRMIVLSVSKNRLVGSIPPQLGGLVALKQRLDLSYNAFNGLIPSELNRLSNLERLLLNHNQLVGTVPDLSGLRRLKQLSLEGNQLRGEISNGTCTLLSTTGADASADCSPNSAGGRAFVVCSCCTTCCDSRANATCVAV
jgi:hypothetical protein